MGCKAEDYPEWVKFIDNSKRAGQKPITTDCPIYPDLEELLLKDGYFIGREYDDNGKHVLTFIDWFPLKRYG